MNAKHMPPWKVITHPVAHGDRYNEELVVIVDADGRHIAAMEGEYVRRMFPGCKHPSETGNSYFSETELPRFSHAARLISAAPEMHEALEKDAELIAAEWMGLGPDANSDSFRLVQDALERIRAATAKARGEVT